MVERNEQNVATMVELLHEDLFNFIQLDRRYYQLISHEQHQVEKDDLIYKSENWTCSKIKGA